MRAVLDTNTLISAAITQGGPPSRVFDRLARGAFTSIYSDPLRAELLRVLGREHVRRLVAQRGGNVETVIRITELRGERVEPQRRIRVCRDPKDNLVLEAAVAGGAEVIVTGDEDLLVLDPFEGIRIVNSAEFLRLLDEELTPQPGGAGSLASG